MENHNIPPIYDENSKILILGSFPSVKSREGKFFYNHPQNRFWKVISNVIEYPEPTTIDEKVKMLIDNNIALWDVIKSCDIIGSSDSSIKNVVPNDIYHIIEVSKVKRIFTNGTTAHKMYQKYVSKLVKVPETVLPSTSPANAKFRLCNLIDSWKVIKEALIE